MNKVLGALAAVVLALVMLTPPAAAHCWWQGHRRHCRHSHHDGRHHRPYYPTYVYPEYHSYSYYPYVYYQPAYVCFPFWPFCW